MKNSKVRLFLLIVPMVFFTISCKTTKAERPKTKLELRQHSSQMLHTFKVNAPDAKEVCLAGEMNDWNPKTLLMRKKRSGNWELSLYLNQGRWQYKYVIDGAWTKDKWRENPEEYKDHHNSILILGELNKDILKNENISHGKVEHIKIKSKAYGKTARFNVYTPPNYNKKDKLPVLYLLHGYGGSEHNWTKDGGFIQNYMDNYINSKTVKPFIIVMPMGHRSFYQGKTEDFIINELIPYIQKTYNTKTDKNQTGIGGLSMGGYGTFYLAYKHQDKFGIALPLSGYYGTNIHNTDLIDIHKENIQTLNFDLHVYCGNEDSYCFESTEDLAKLLKSKSIKFGYYIADGEGHTWRYWNSITKDFLIKTSDFFYGDK